MIQFTSIVQNPDRTWTFTWDSVVGASTYNVVLAGILLEVTTTTTYTWSGFEYQGKFPPPLEVTNDSNLALSQQFQPYLIMQWYGESSAAYYSVQQLISGVSVVIANVQESGSWVYTFQTVPLLDESLYQFQVVAIDVVGNDSTPRTYARYVVTPPQPPDANIVISYTKPNVTINPV